MQLGNLFTNIPNQLPDELFEDIVKTSNIRVERILSDGHSTPDGEWFDQAENEWVAVLQGQGVLEYEDGQTITLDVGDYVNIPAHVKHRVKSTASGATTIWLAIFY
ncbi:cupin domain-containing protein [Vibrio maritimus]|uniref:cupin domain-containing protein n=1 Tax=Vibrio maritimus TaxID=990268 RepID=UPI0037360277